MSRGTREQNSNPDGFLVLGTSELRDLLDDEDKMHQIVRLSAKFQELQVDRETMLTTNRSLAEESLSRQPGLQNGKLQLADKYRKLEHLATVCREKQRRLAGTYVLLFLWIKQMFADGKWEDYRPSCQTAQAPRCTVRQDGREFLPRRTSDSHFRKRWETSIGKNRIPFRTPLGSGNWEGAVRTVHTLALLSEPFICTAPLWRALRKCGQAALPRRLEQPGQLRADRKQDPLPREKPFLPAEQASQAYIQKRSPQVARTLLQEEVSRAEEESEDLLEKFMEGSLPLEGFLDSFQSIRKTCHIRRAQAEKIQELLKPNQNLRKPKNSGEEKKAAQQEPPSNGFSAQGPPRVFQLRYGLTPAILLPHFPLPSTSAIAHAASLPPLDSQPGQAQALGPSAPHSIPGQPVGLRVIGQLPGWPARPVRLQQICRQHNHHQPEPPYR
ncbi:VP37D protein, partial [Atractosteus spatula]|nr:VP37D protein [Atractosteus spatula]